MSPQVGLAVPSARVVREKEREKEREFIARHPPTEGNDDYDGKYSWMSNGYPSRRRSRGVTAQDCDDCTFFG